MVAVSERRFRIKEVAALAGVSVRALHHYDEIGLLTPRGRTASGYRLYAEADLLRLQQIVIGRELGLSLEQIRRSLDDPAFDRSAALRAQRHELEARRARAEKMLAAIDTALALIEGETTMSHETSYAKMFEGFEAEAKARWGHTDAYAESQRRTKRYTPEDWARMQAEQAAIYTDATALMAAGVAPTSDEARAVAERHRESIDRWFYPCSKEMHAALANLYESDDRFRANIDKHGEGLTAFLAAAIRAQATE